MGKKGGKGHMKRQAAPGFWPIHRKEFAWAVRPSAGPHPIHQSIPLVLVVREMLGLAKTRSEAKKVISQGQIMVDGRVRRDERYPTGLMDVVSLPEIGANYRVLPSEKGLILRPITEEEAKFKLCRIEDKKTLDKGQVEINLHDGRNLLVKVANPKDPAEDVYETLDTLKIGISDQEVLEHLKLGKEILAAFVEGSNKGKYGTITSIEEQTGQKRRRFLVTVRDEKGQSYQTILDYAVVVGDKTARISLPSLEGQ